MAMHDPVLHQFITYLAEKKAEQADRPEVHTTIEVPRALIAGVRESFRKNILDGERHLHLLSHLLSSLLLEGQFELHSHVIGLLPGEGERPFMIRERITRETLFSKMDIDLGNHLLDNFRYRQGRSWVPLELSANFVEYIPLRRPRSGVNRLTSRVKAEEELWNKVTDELFLLDELVNTDKHLKQYSKYIKDVFGIKIVCEDDMTCLAVHNQIREFRMRDCPPLDEWHTNIPLNVRPSHARLLEFIETKDYLMCDPSQMKKTGWRALKSVVRWHDRLFEIQVQPLGNYYLELDHMSGPSHRSFKLGRDAMRSDVSRHVPLYGFYRDLLKKLFVETDPSFQHDRPGGDFAFDCGNASVVIT
jgi:hypothetical protein